jgi:hypothetical protein
VRVERMGAPAIELVSEILRPDWKASSAHDITTVTISAENVRSGSRFRDLPRRRCGQTKCQRLIRSARSGLI